MKFVFEESVTNNCDEPDLPLDSIKKVDFSNNKFPHMKEQVVALLQVGYDDSSKLLDKFTMTNNTAALPCDCSEMTPTDSEEQEDIDNDKLHMSMVKNSKCQAKVKNYLIAGG